MAEISVDVGQDVGLRRTWLRYVLVLGSWTATNMGEVSAGTINGLKLAV